MQCNPNIKIIIFEIYSDNTTKCNRNNNSNNNNNRNNNSNNNSNP